MKIKSIEEVRYLVVHCSATPPTHDWTVDDVRRDHKLKGFLDVGYHFVIRRDGTVDTGRKLPSMGAHVTGHNHESVGVCLIGGVNDKRDAEDNFTVEQYQSLKNLLTELVKLFPGAQVVGHRDLPKVNKACPSFNVKSWWQDALTSMGEHKCKLS